MILMTAALILAGGVLAAIAASEHEFRKGR